jgi:hypothetical protein
MSHVILSEDDNENNIGYEIGTDPIYGILNSSDDEESKENKEKKYDSDKEIDELLNKNLGMIKSLSFDSRSCIICLVENNDETNKEPVVINHVCKNCSYYVHDSCFSSWYEKHNKCIICRNKIDMTDGTDNVNITPRTFSRLLSIVNSRGVDVIGIVGSTNIGGPFIPHTTYNCRYFIINVIYITTLTWFFYILFMGMLSINEIPGSI